MKVLTIIITLTLFLITSLNASSKPKVAAQIKDNTVETLMMGLKSDNIGLQSSSKFCIMKRTKN